MDSEDLVNEITLAIDDNLFRFLSDTINTLDYSEPGTVLLLPEHLQWQSENLRKSLTKDVNEIVTRMFIMTRAMRQEMLSSAEYQKKLESLQAMQKLSSEISKKVSELLNK